MFQKQKIIPIGNNKHLKLLCHKGGNVFQSLLFGVTPEQFCFCVGDTLDLAVTLDTNLFQGQYTLSVQIKALRMSSSDDDTFFESKNQYDDFMSKKDVDYDAIFPDRSQVGSIYKLINNAPVKIERLKYLNTGLNFAQMQISVKTLCELGLIDEKDGVLTAMNVNEKTDLLNSKTYKLIYERVNKDE